jgi:hypothetical protein
MSGTTTATSTWSSPSASRVLRLLAQTAIKLYNCWHAGVPAVLGAESAFRANRRSDLDYLEVQSLDARGQRPARMRVQARGSLQLALVVLTRPGGAGPAPGGFEIADSWRRDRPRHNQS